MSSTLAHSLFFMEKTGQFFTLLDHCMISVVIAGTTTPFILTLFSDSILGNYFFNFKGIFMFVTIWLMCLTCLLLSYLSSIDLVDEKYELIMFILMGGSPLVFINKLIHCLGFYGMVYILSGGFFYLFGVIFFVKGIFFFILGKTTPKYHSIWHLCVIIASILHYLAVYNYCVPCHFS
jgi:hemolysin III